MTPHRTNRDIALIAYLLGFGTGMAIIVGLVPATLALVRALI
jgi:hypothetical protein